jgi:hypothetical protein
LRAASAEHGRRHDGIDVEVVDVKDYNLPVFDEPQSPGPTRLPHCAGPDRTTPHDGQATAGAMA